MTKYFLRIRTEQGDDDRPLSATTDNGARRQAQRSLREVPAPADAIIALMFTRSNDGCIGQIDR